MKPMNKSILAAAAAQVLMLAACGGGGGDDTAAAKLTLKGTAATGAAIAGGKVDVKCAAGTGSATTGSDGSYTVTLEGGALPCVLKVTKDGTELYSLADSGSGSTVNANITPFTQLIAAQLAGGSPSGLYDNFDAAAQAKLSTSGVSGAVAAVTEALKGTVDLGSANPLTAEFKVGDALDQKLDAFKAALDSAQVTLADVTTAVAASGGSAAPVATLLQPAASTCDGLRSGKYRALNASESDPAWADHVFTLDAATLVAKFHDNGTTTFVDDGHCSFHVQDDDGVTTQLLVSKSGVSVALDSTSTPGMSAVSVLVPEQAIALSELSGTWNMLGMRRAGTSAPFKPYSQTFSLDAAGKFLQGADCAGLTACTAWSGMPGNLTAASGGGFQYTGTDARVHKVHAFKSADGHVTMYILDNELGLSVAAKQQAQTLPALNSVSMFWDLSIGTSGMAGAVGDNTTTVQTVDATAGSFTRVRGSDGRVDGFTLNKPRDGLRYRAAGTSPLTGGGTANLSEIIVMPLPGTGASTYISVSPNQNFLGISVNHP